MTGGEIAVVALAVLIGASIKSITGMGLPPVVIPVLASFVGPENAIVTMSLTTVVTNVYVAWHYRDARGEARHLGRTVVAGAIGTPLGVLLFTSLDSSTIGVIIGVTALLFVATSLANPRLRIGQAAGRRAAAPVGFGAGILQGATGLSGVILASYLHVLGLSQRAFAFSIAILFQVFALVQIAGFVIAGRYTADIVLASVLATGGAMVVIFLGARFVAVRVSQRAFRYVILTVLGLSAVKLLVDAL